MNLNTAITKRLKEIIKAKNITQYRLSANSGVPQSTISTILNGKNNDFKLATILALIYGLDITAKDFFDSELFDYDNLLLK